MNILKTQPHLVLTKNRFFTAVENGLQKVDKNCIWSIKDKTILLECSVMLNYQLQIVGDVFVTSIGHDDEFYVNLLFDRSIYRRMCTHMG